MRNTISVFVLLLAVGLLAYSNSFDVPFQFDGLRQIAENPMIKSLDNFEPILAGHAVHPPSGFEYNNRRLVGYLTLALNYHFGGLDVAGYHVVNLIVHIINGLLVYLLVILTFRTPYFSDQPGVQLEAGRPEGDQAGRPAYKDSRFLMAIVAALLFVAHPIQTQAVTYVVQRFTSLTATFYLLAIVFYIEGRLSIRQAGKLAGLFCSLLFAVLAMMTKEIAFTLPLIIVLYEFSFFKSTLKKKLLFLLPVLLTIAIVPISVMGAHKPLGELLSDLSEKTRVQTGIPRWDYLMTQMRVITTYVRLLFLPVNQNLDYDYPIYHSLSQPPVILSSLFLFSLLGLGVYLLLRSSLKNGGLRPEDGSLSPRPLTSNLYRLIGFGIFWFFITLSVESSLIPIADVMFEHRVYLPSVGAFIAVSAAGVIIIRKIGSRQRTVKIVISALSASVIVLLAGATFVRNAVWKDPFLLWQDVTRKSPGNARAYNNLGYLYLMSGRTYKSIEYFRAALRFRPYYSNAHTNLGVAYYNKGLTDAAIAQFRRALDLDSYGPDVAEDHHNLGIAFTKKGMLDEAIPEFRAALRLTPRDAGIYNDLGVAYRQKGRIDEAIDSFRRAIELEPGYAGAHYNMGVALESVGLKKDARKHLLEARRLDPGRF